jgi:hypothetical protein
MTSIISPNMTNISAGNTTRITGQQHKELAIMANTFVNAKARGEHANLIGMIKRFRTFTADNSLNNKKLNLRDSKFAIERFVDEHNGVATLNDTRPSIRIGMSIHGVVVDTGEGKVEIDLDELQLRGLSQINDIEISELSRILDLVEFLTAWSTHQDISYSIPNKESDDE